ncbi:MULTISPECIES: hypothetical protein [Henriciella]|jgi:hypothetical protein|uniref:hypothetical protein n=1 Tax=Henriciella TaxID=453849 RepID=UPI0035129E07
MNSKFDYRPGDVVSVRFGGVLRHYGVVTHGGRILSSNGRYGGVVSQSFEAFARGRDIQNHGPGEGESDYLASARANRRLGHDYHLTGSNCVHFVRHARGRGPTATQVARGAFEAVRDMLKPYRRS